MDGEHARCIRLFLYQSLEIFGNGNQTLGHLTIHTAVCCKIAYENFANVQIAKHMTKCEHHAKIERHFGVHKWAINITNTMYRRTFVCGSSTGVIHSDRYQHEGSPSHSANPMRLKMGVAHHPQVPRKDREPWGYHWGTPCYPKTKGFPTQTTRFRAFRAG